MADPYVIFPGTAGNYVDTPDTSIMDADSSHLEQSIGKWTGLGGATAVVQNQTITPVFGTQHGRLTLGGSASYAYTGTAQNFLVDASTEYTVSLSATASFSGTLRMRVTELDSGNGVIAQLDEDVAVTANQWQQFAYTRTTASNATALAVRIGYGGVDQSGEFVYFDAACIRLGTDGTFIPSLRVVGDLELEADLYLSDWEPAANQAPIGYGADAAERRYNMFIRDGNVQHFWYDDGDTQRNVSLPHGITGSGRHTIRIEHSDIGGANASCQLYVDGVAVGSAASVVSSHIRSAPGTVEVGRNAGSQMMAGNAYTVTVRDGIDGPIVARFDAGDVPQPAQLPI